MPTIDVLDSNIYHEETGSGTALVLLHGNPGSLHQWRQVLACLGSGRLLARPCGAPHGGAELIFPQP